MSDIGYNSGIREDEAQFGDFFELLKPRVMSLVVFTALVGLIAAPVDPARVAAAQRRLPYLRDCVKL